MKNLNQIINDKATGQDCTEAESAEIKHLIRMIQHHFPLEWTEALEENIDVRKETQPL